MKSWVLDPDLEKSRRIDPRIIVDAAVGTVSGGIPNDIESMRYVRRYPQELPQLAELLPQITTAVTIINGRTDRVVPLANAEFLRARLPDSRVVVIDAGHFVWEEPPAEYAAAIIESITSVR